MLVLCLLCKIIEQDFLLKKKRNVGSFLNFITSFVLNPLNWMKSN